MSVPQTTSSILSTFIPKHLTDIVLGYHEDKQIFKESLSFKNCSVFLRHLDSDCDSLIHINSVFKKVLKEDCIDNKHTEEILQHGTPAAKISEVNDVKNKIFKSLSDKDIVSEENFALMQREIQVLGDPSKEEISKEVQQKMLEMFKCAEVIRKFYALMKGLRRQNDNKLTVDILDKELVVVTTKEKKERSIKVQNMGFGESFLRELSERSSELIIQGIFDRLCNWGFKDTTAILSFLMDSPEFTPMFRGDLYKLGKSWPNEVHPFLLKDREARLEKYKGNKELYEAVYRVANPDQPEKPYMELK